MEKFIVRQSEALHGTVRISGAKNAVLPILAACLLTEEPCTITNVPPLTDVLEMAELLKEFGAETSYDGLTETIKICSETLSNQQAAEKNACAMRASFLAAGPLLARCHQAALPLPGGCPIGSRPVDLHLKGFSIMGAVHKLEHGVVELSAKNGLRGKRVYLDFPSVGATENIMMAAFSAKNGGGNYWGRHRYHCHSRAETASWRHTQCHFRPHRGRNIYDSSRYYWR